MNLKIDYINTENIKNPVSTFQVTGEHQGVPVNEVVSLNIEELQEHVYQNLDVLTFLQIIVDSRTDLENSQIYPLIVNKAYEKSAKAYKKLETFKLMMSLSTKTKKDKRLTTYDNKGNVNKYDPNGSARLNIFR